jgi:hypothetical protein
VQVLSEKSITEMRKMHTVPEQIKYAPKAAEGFGYALGSWVLEEGPNSIAKAEASPGLFGTWPVVDWCRKYASIVFVKTLLSEQKADVYMQMKDAIDEKIHPKCGD